MLTDQLDKLELSIAERQALRCALANPEAYRLRMGHRTFSAGMIVEAVTLADIDTTWRDELSIVGEGFFRFVEAGQLSLVLV